jgi:hypothetical protein
MMLLNRGNQAYYLPAIAIYATFWTIWRVRPTDCGVQRRADPILGQYTITPVSNAK